MSNSYAGPYSPEWYEAYDPSYENVDASVSIPWYAGVTKIISSIGQTAASVMQAKQGIVRDAAGNIVSAYGQAVKPPSTTLSGLVSSASLTSLLLVGLGVFLVIKLIK